MAYKLEVLQCSQLNVTQCYKCTKSPSCWFLFFFCDMHLSLGEMRPEDLWGSPASQPRLTSEIQASERCCLTKQGGQLSWGMIPKADLQLLHAHTHMCTCACTLQHIRTHACTHWWVPQNHLKKEPNIRRIISSNLCWESHIEATLVCALERQGKDRTVVAQGRHRWLLRGLVSLGLTLLAQPGRSPELWTYDWRVFLFVPDFS